MSAPQARDASAPPPPEPDSALYERWADGDRVAGEMLIDRHLDTVGRFIANKCADPSGLEDLVAVVFEQCAKSLGRFRGTSSFRTYLLGIALNVVRDHLKRRARAPQFDEERSIADLSPSPSAVLAQRREQSILLQALRTLPFSLQVVLELHFFEDLSQREVSEVLEIPAGTVASRLRRAKEALRTAIETVARDPAESTATLTRLDDWVADLRHELGLVDHPLENSATA